MEALSRSSWLFLNTLARYSSDSSTHTCRYRSSFSQTVRPERNFPPCIVLSTTFFLPAASRYSISKDTRIYGQQSFFHARHNHQDAKTITHEDNSRLVSTSSLEYTLSTPPTSPNGVVTHTYYRHQPDSSPESHSTRNSITLLRKNAKVESQVEMSVSPSLPSG